MKGKNTVMPLEVKSGLTINSFVSEINYKEIKRLRVTWMAIAPTLRL